MKIAIPASTNKPEAKMDERFSRCSFFCIYDPDTGDMSFPENTLKDGSGGVGPQVVEFLAKQGVQEIYTPEVGPRAQNMLNKLDIKINMIASGSSIRDVIALSNQQKKS